MDIFSFSAVNLKNLFHFLIHHKNKPVNFAFFEKSRYNAKAPKIFSMSEQKKPIKTSRLSWDEAFINLALLISKRAACRFHETGVVFVDKNKRIISLGYNGPTEGDDHCLEVGCAKVNGDPVTGKVRRCRGAHAEINGIINAQDTKRLRGSTAYMVLFPCYDCMKALNNAGVKEIVYFKEYERIQTGGEKFEEEDEARDLAVKKGIKMRRFRPKKVTNLFIYQEGKCPC
jgi:dCMP deaminase